MKKLLALLAVVLAVVSCQTEPEGLDVNVGGAVDTEITVSLPEAATRATAGEDSALGAIANKVIESDDYTLRYIFAVYYNDETHPDNRQVVCSDATTVSFPVRLVPGRDYKFVVWADIVKESEKTDWHYNTTNLEAITLNETSWKAMDETRDAYTAVEPVTNYNGAKDINITLKRPFAKLRIVTTDREELARLGITPSYATVKYTTAHRTTFNALTGKSVETNVVSTTKEHSYAIDAYNSNSENNMTLFTDYFFAEKDIVKFEMNVYEDAAKTKLIKENIFNTDIYVEENRLTTLIGNVLTDGNNIKVVIDDTLPECQYNIESLEDLKAALNTPNANIKLTNDITTAEKLTISNSVTIDGNGKTITYTGSEWLFDVPMIETRANSVNQNFTLKNVNIKFETSYCQRGINCNTGATITIENVNIIEGTTYPTYAINLQGKANDAKVEIKDSNIKGCIALNVWGQNVVANVTNSILSNYDTADHEDYATVKLNNNGTVSAEHSIININGGKVIAKDQTGAACVAIINDSETGQINVSGTTEVTGTTANSVAAVRYNGSDNFYGCYTLAAAIERATNDSNATIVLVRDIEISETQWIEGNVTLDLNNKTISCTADRFFRIKNEGTEVINVTIKNGKLLNTADGGRCVETRSGDINLTLEDVELEATNGTWPQPLTIGGSGENITVNINESSIKSSYVGYGITTFNPVVLNVTNTTIDAWAALNLREPLSSLGSNGSEIKVTGSNFICKNITSGESNSFAAIKVADDGIDLNIDSTNTITVEASGDQPQGVIDFGSINNPIIEDCNVTIAAEINANGNPLILPKDSIGDNNVIKFAAKYAETLKSENWNISEAVDGFVTIIRIATADDLEKALENAKAGDTITIAGDITLTENVTIPAGVTFNGNGKQINGTLVAGGDIAFAGHTKVTAFSAGFSGYEITIGEGACLEITGGGRSTMGYNNTFNITGTITDAESADKANIQPSLIMPAGISITGGNGLELNIKDAYVQLGSTSSKPGVANGTFTINIENSIAEFTDQLTFSGPTNGMNPTFNLNVKNSVLTTAAKLNITAPNTNMVVDNSTIDVKTNFRNSGNVELKNGSVLTGNTIQFSENSGHDGTTTVDASKFTIKASSTGHALDGRGIGSITLKNGAEVSVDYYKALTINCDASSTFTGTEVF